MLCQTRSISRDDVTLRLHTTTTGRTRHFTYVIHGGAAVCNILSLCDYCGLTWPWRWDHVRRHVRWCQRWKYKLVGVINPYCPSIENKCVPCVSGSWIFCQTKVQPLAAAPSPIYIYTLTFASGLRLSSADVCSHHAVSLRGRGLQVQLSHWNLLHCYCEHELQSRTPCRL